MKVIFAEEALRENVELNFKEIQAVDLFSGAGGLSLAALNLNISIRAAVELDTDSCKTYSKNIIDARKHAVKLYNEDILKLSPETILKDTGLLSGDLDLLMGGPPCQGFSSHRINNAGVDDPRNNLLIRYFDFVKALSPKVFLVENVPGLLWKRHESYLERFTELAEKNGYNLFKPITLNAKDFGVPQNRRRVFILGVKNTLPLDDIPWPPKQTHSEKDEVKFRWQTASTVFEQPSNVVIQLLAEKIGKEKAESLKFGSPILSVAQDRSAIRMNHTPALVERFTATPINGGRDDIDFTLPCHANGYVGHKDVYGRIRLGQPGPTITTGCFNPSKGRFLHPWLHHGITIRHAARFQTFPDDFFFEGGMTSQGKQIGNAVPVQLGEAIISSIFKKLITQQK